MAYKGPEGLWGKPAPEEIDQYVLYEVEDDPQLKCWLKNDVLEWMEKNTPTPEGDYLFSVEGAGRLRFRLV